MNTKMNRGALNTEKIQSQYDIIFKTRFLFLQCNEKLST